MDCKQVREQLPDVAAGMGGNTGESQVEDSISMDQHIASCAGCRAELLELQKTMTLLDEWQVPEPSPYFDTRMQARLREEMARPAGWLSWVRRPAWAMSLAAILFAGALAIGVGGGKSYLYETEAMKTEPPSLGLPIQPGTAVGDLQALEKNDELYADFDVLDELQVQDDVTQNP
jgi:predicted anti-sigma-YlaC factor YlaD